MLRDFESEIEAEAAAAEAEPLLPCPGMSYYTAKGFPRYRNTVGSLPGAEQAKIRAVAGLIVASFRLGCRPVRAVRLVGHADKDLQRGPVFERQISEARAAAVQVALKRHINHPAIVSRIAWQPAGVGATSLAVRNPATEQQRARNRRVDIHLSTATPERGYAVLVRHPRLGYVWTVSPPRPAIAAARRQAQGEINISPDPTAVFDSQKHPFKWICFLEIDFGPEITPAGVVTGKRKFGRATGTLISPRHVLTAGHALLSREPDRRDVLGQPVVQLASALSVTVIPGRDGGKVPAIEPQRRISAGSNPLRTSQQWRSSNASSPGFDFGLITLDKPLPPDYGFWTSNNGQIGALAMPALQGKFAHTSGYPAQFCPPPDPRFTAHCTDMTRGTVQFQMSGTITNVDRDRIENELKIQHGHSGSPVWLFQGRESRPVLVGIASTRREPGPAEAVRIRDSVLTELRSWMIADQVRPSF
jgi:hypothetical protein